MESFTVKQAIDAHVGGIADFGDPDARWMVPLARNYQQYKAKIHQQLKSRYPMKVFILWRSCYPREIEDGTLDHGDIKKQAMTSCTLLEKVARAWHSLAAKKGQERVLVKMAVHVEDVVFFGHESEAEYVIRKPLKWEIVNDG